MCQELVHESIRLLPAGGPHHPNLRFPKACSRYSALASTSGGMRPEIVSTSKWIAPVLPRSDLR